MKREILEHKRKKKINGCCPGHDEWPDETYSSRLSRKARSRDKKKEHKYVRLLRKQQLRRDLGL